MDHSKSDFTRKYLKNYVIYDSRFRSAYLQALWSSDLLVVRFGTTTDSAAYRKSSFKLITFVVTLCDGNTVLIARYIGEKKMNSIGALIGGATVFLQLFLNYICSYDYVSITNFNFNAST
ncbi:MAG: hypothetical protein ACLTMR_05500 [Faecalibacillus sp.]